MYIRKKRGPNTVPCGTPDKTGHGSEREPSTTTCCVRHWRNEADHERRESLIPIECILRSSVVWSTLSSALEKSKRMVSIWLDWSRVFAKSVTVSISSDSQLCR